MTSEVEQTNSDYIIDSDIGWNNWRIHIREIIKYRYLLFNLIRRDLKVKYRDSLLGVVWSLLSPLLMILVFSLIFAKLIPREDIRNYGIFFLVALLPWNFFTGSMISGTTSVTGSSSLVKKVYFPRVLLPTSAIISNLVNFLIAFVVLIIFLYVAGIGLTIHAAWVPAILFTQLVFTLGLVFFLSSLNVFYRDVIMILDVILLAWFFLTPVIYPLDWLGETQTILGITFNPAVVMRWINPMASIVDGYRTVLWGTMGSSGPVAMDPIYLIRTFVTAVFVLFIGFVLFSRTRHLFGEKL
jgi:ABC-type polysaccharide/polyol phosphate export permease